MQSAPWAPYRPTDAAPWDWTGAWTLRRRAGFGATWRELERDVADGPGASVDHVLDGACRLDGVPADFARTAELLGASAAGSGDPRRLQAWWLYRMLATPDPLRERITLMWHDHFATSQLKVDDVGLMHRQNETFRRLGMGPFRDLLAEMLRDPALLTWLDAPSNRKAKPNENLARELMELFTLGVNRYTEADVKAAARALTGRTVVRGAYKFRPDDHDDAPLALLGRAGPLDGEALVDLLLAQPAAAENLAARLCDTFLGEGTAEAGDLAALAASLRADDLHVGRAVARILRSERFHSRPNQFTKVADPVGFVVGAVRGLERFDKLPSTLLLAEWADRLGQGLFFPPNVGGWPGGRAWLTGRAVVGRANFAAALAGGKLNADARPPDLAALAARVAPGVEGPALLDPLGRLLLGRPVAAEVADTLWPAAGPNPLNHAVALLLGRPEAQLA